MFATVLDAYPRAADAATTDLDALAQVLSDQLDAGLGMVSDGRIRGIPADASAAEFDAAVDAWTLASDTIGALVAQLEPGIEAPLVKACLVGPYSAARRSRPDAVASARRRATLEAAERSHELAELLFRAGAPVVQLAEDEVRRVGDGDRAERDLAAAAFRRATDGLRGHLSLSVSGGNADAAGAALFFDAPFSSYAFDLINGPDNWRLITQAPTDRGIICGVADARTPARDDEALMVWAARYAASANARGPERVGLAPSAGLELLPRDVARAKLGMLAEAARKAGLPAADLARQLDPRAVDARSGALGRFDPEVAARLGRRLPGRTR